MKIKKIYIKNIGNVIEQKLEFDDQINFIEKNQKEIFKAISVVSINPFMPAYMKDIKTDDQTYIEAEVMIDGFCYEYIYENKKTYITCEDEDKKQYYLRVVAKPKEISLLNFYKANTIDYHEKLKKYGNKEDDYVIEKLEKDTNYVSRTSFFRKEIKERIKEENHKEYSEIEKYLSLKKLWDNIQNSRDFNAVKQPICMFLNEEEIKNKVYNYKSFNNRQLFISKDI